MTQWMTPLAVRTRHSYASIQVLRAVAALLVVGVHFTVVAKAYLGRSVLGGALAFGASGVDVFFVISGFILTTVHHADIGRRERLRAFVVKRFIRIVPLYWLITLILLPIYLAGHGEVGQRSGEAVVRSFLLLPQQPRTSPVVSVGWTLTYELFFYLMFGALIGLSRRPRCVAWAAWLGPTLVWTAVSLVSGDHPLQGHIWGQLVFSDRSLEFVLGCVVARLVAQGRIPFPSLLVVVGTLAFVLVGVDPWGWGLPDHTQLAYGIPAAVVVAGAAARDTSGPIRWPKWALRLGDASYALYLIHYTLILIAFRALQHLPRLPEPVFDLAIAVGALTLCVLSILVHVKLERPMIVRLRARLLPSDAAEPLVASPGEQALLHEHELADDPPDDLAEPSA